MVIIAGKNKVKRSPVGFAVAYCRLCRSMCVHHCTEVRLFKHVWYVSLGKGTPRLIEARCERCKVVCGYTIGSFSAFVADPTQDELEMAAETTPNLLDVLGTRLDLEEALENRTAPHDLRIEMIAEPIEACRYAMLQGDGAPLRWLQQACGAALLAFATASVAMVLTQGISSLAITLFLCALAWLAVGLAIERYRLRILRREVLIPRIAASLRVLNPTREEVGEAIASLRRAKSIAARWAKADEISDALERQG